MVRPLPTTVRRAESLEGDDAITWLSSVGYRVLGDRIPRLYLDEVRTNDLRIARFWYSEASLVREPPSSRAIIVLFHVDGSIEVEAAGWAAEAGPGAVVALPVETASRITARAAGARLEIEIDADQVPDDVRRAALDGGTLAEEARPLANVVISMMNAAFNAELSPRDVGYPSFQLAIRTLVAGVLTAGAADDAGIPRRAALLARARRVIAAHAVRRDFSTASLCRELRVSARYLQEVFAEQGSSPAAEIRARRAEVARALRESQGRSLRADDIARLSGFGSASSMRRAI